MYILGISAFYHDSAATLIKDGHILCAVEEERFSRIKHDNQFPSQAIKYCLERAGISINKIEIISYYEKPLLKFERILENFIKTFPFSLLMFIREMPGWLNNKIKVEQTIRKELDFKGEVFFIPHHLSHASACFFTSPFQEASVVTIDGVGEHQTTALWHGEDNTITLLKELHFPHSLGLLYSTFTSFLGFQVNDDEYKVMGLAAYGHPIYVDKIKQVITIQEDGSFELVLKYFSFHKNSQMWSKEFEKIFGTPRVKDAPVTQREADVAASIQKITEEIYVRILIHMSHLTSSKNICVGGGVALNALANGKIHSQTPFTKVRVWGPSGDSGGAVGAALFTYYSMLNNKERISTDNLSLGTRYTNQEVELVLSTYKVRYKKMTEEELLKEVATLLSRNKVIGWFQGAMEFGPRALGSRSILANPKPRFMKEQVNKIKIREDFRPFAGSILQEKVHEYFIVPEENYSAPFMNFCFKVRPEKKEEIAAIVHDDDTSRIQTINDQNGIYHKLIKSFYETTGIPCLLNTSFNLKGEPIVENPQQAVEDFLKTEMDYLVIESFIVSK